ncbi:Rhodanese-related sulfurtransferase [Burkholderiales bacterium JOSHI_001]|nr:Rhodanese-related sulfurtransferase [Burkholderiales bacterium JOSHI_001]
MTHASSFLLRRFVLHGALAVAGLAAAGGVLAADALPSATLEEARAALQAPGQTLVIDIRETDEHAQGVAQGAKLVPMRQVAAQWASLVPDKNKPVLLMCRTQNRSSALAKALREQGITNVRHVEGGMSEWARRGWPMVKPGR